LALRAERGELTRQILEREANGEHLLPPELPVLSVRRDQALKLLNGPAHHLAQNKLKDGSAWAQPIERRRVVEKAIEFGCDMATDLRARPAIEKVETRKPEIEKIARRIFDAIVALEAALQERDQIAREIGGPVPVLLDGVPFCR
jgi:hypothetical protein